MGRTFSDVAATAPRIRVVQWATGNIGTKACREVILHPGLELVGLRVYSADKVGRDAGELCGLPPVGVPAVGSLDEVLALAPDCVLYMPRFADLDDLCALLAAGIDVVSTAGLVHHPASMDPEVRGRLEAACATGGSSLHATGSSPGFITEALPIALLSTQRSLSLLAIDEFADMSQRPSPELLFQIMGFGRAPEHFSPARWEHGAISFGPSLRLLAEAMGTPLNEVVSHGELALVPHDVEIAAGVVPAGTVGGQRMVVSGRRHGVELVRFRANWFCTTELDADWPLRDTGWRIQVQGDAPMDVDVHFPITTEQMAATTPGYTANRAVNAVPFVVAAAPGIHAITDLPSIVPWLRTDPA